MAAPAVAAIGFYHLTRDPLSLGVAKLLERVYGQGLRAVVRMATPALMDALDAALWTYEKVSFLPHATPRNGEADLQPILLTTDDAVPNGATVVLLLENVLPEDISRFDRVLYMFEGRDDAAVSAARAHWLALKAKGLPLEYWQQGDTGGWRKAATA